MKIKNIISYTLSSPIKSKIKYYGYSNWKNISVIEVHTNNNIIGYGETYSGVYCSKLASNVVDYLKEFLIGVELENLISQKYSLNLPFVGYSGLVKSVYSGIEIAIYDILSKSKKMTLSQYLKAAYKYFDNGINTLEYASNGSVLYSPKQISDDVKNIIDLGYNNYKMRIGIQNKETDIKRIESAKKILGNNRRLMIDIIMGTNPNKLSYDEILKWCDILNSYDVYWFEEPFSPHEINLYKKLKNKSCINVAGGEALTSEFEFKMYKENDVVDIIQPDVTNCGGINECINVISLFDKNNIAMHVWGSQLSINSNTHFAKAFNIGWLEVPMMQLEINDYIQNEDYGIQIKIDENIKQKYKFRNNNDFKTN